jgi:DJ-1 family protein
MSRETSTLVDVLRRGGVEVVLAGLGGPDPVKGSRGMRFVPDAAFDPADRVFDLVVLPGGMGGTEQMAGDDRLIGLLRERVALGQPVAALCAAPMVLDAADVLPEGSYTCYPGIEARLETAGRRTEVVVDSGGVITSQGPGTAMAFALYLVERLEGPERRRQVAEALLYGKA